MKLAVGIKDFEHLCSFVSSNFQLIDGVPCNLVYTRLMPKYADEILSSHGSLYRVINGIMCCRQRIVGFDSAYTTKGKQTVILLDRELIRTKSKLIRPFQGWRYLEKSKAPVDIPVIRKSNDQLPVHILEELRKVGVY